MNNTEKENLHKKRRSLSVKTVTFTFMCSTCLWLVAVSIGLILYGRVLMGQYIQHAFDLAEGVSNSVLRGADSVPLSRQVMGIYNSLSEEQRQKMGTQEYRDYFSEIDRSKGGAYDVLFHMLEAYTRDNDDADLIYLVMYDETHNAVVYIVDPDSDSPLQPGEWESVDPEEVQRFLHWNGKGMLYIINYSKEYGWMCTSGVPIRDRESKETVAYVLVDLSIGKVISGIREYALKITVALLIATLIISLILVRHVNKALVEPINRITRSAEEYVKSKKSGNTFTESFSRLDIKTEDELENLSHVMADMEHDLTDYEQRIVRISAEKERANAELKFAATIQQSALQTDFPAFSDRSEFDIYATMEPAKVVGGDFYDFFLIDDDHLCFTIADVSDKGVAAALFMMAAQAVLRNNAMLGKSPAEILTDSNMSLCSNNRQMMFVTVWLGILEISTGILQYANAGHEPPAFYQEGKEAECIKNDSFPAVGMISGTEYIEYEKTLLPGDIIFLYTDGVTEASDAEGNFWGSRRLMAAFETSGKETAEAVVKYVRDDIRSFVKDAEQYDDMTLLCLKYLSLPVLPG